MDGKLERIVQLRQADQENHSPVSGIHLKVEQDLQIVQNSVFDIVRFINDDNWSLPLIQSKTIDLLLNDMKVFSLPVGRLGTQRRGEIPVEIIHRNGGKAGIDHLIQGRVQSGRPGTDQSCFSTARSAGKKTDLLSFPSSNIKKFHHLRKFPSDGMTLHFISCCCFLQNNKDRQQQTILLSQYKVMTSPFQNRKPDAYKAGRQSLLEVPPLRIHIRTQYSAIPFSPSKSSLPVWV